MCCLFYQIICQLPHVGVRLFKDSNTYHPKVENDIVNLIQYTPINSNVVDPDLYPPSCVIVLGRNLWLNFNANNMPGRKDSGLDKVMASPGG